MAFLLPRSVTLRLLLCFALGAAGAFSMPPFPVYAFPLLMLSLSGFWLILTSFDKGWHAPAAGFVYGFGYFLGGIWWVGNALLVGGNPYLWALPLAVCGLQALLSLFPMMGAACSQWLYKGRTSGAYLFFITMMSFWEWARGTFFTGFPWNLAGMAWTNSLPMLQILSVGGVYFLSLITIFLASVPVFVVLGDATKRVRFFMAAIAVLLFCSLFAYGTLRLEANPTTYNKNVVVQIITPDIPQDQKWDMSLFWNNYLKTVDALALPSDITAPTRVLILPETALHYSALLDSNAREKLRSVLSSWPEKTYLLTGMLRRTQDPKGGEDRHHNSLVAYDQNLRELVTFDKFHLVPFGEYIPFQKYIPFSPVVAFSGFASGPGPLTFSLDGLPAFSPLVCYEVIFPGAVTQQEGKGHPRWMVNVTNDAWYGVSPGPYQHLGHAIYRAIEEGLPMARSTNTGFSAMIDPAGRILSQSALYEQTSQSSYLPLPISEKTLFSHWKNRVFLSLLLLLFIISTALKLKTYKVANKHPVA